MKGYARFWIDVEGRKLSRVVEDSQAFKLESAKGYYAPRAENEELVILHTQALDHTVSERFLIKRFDKSLLRG